jgi:peptidoglycan/xylan/chitin deacetylase (PgdA/CDA1 family)
MMALDTAIALKGAGTRFLRNVLMYQPQRLWLSQIVKKSAGFHTKDRRIIAILSSDTEFDPPPVNGTWKKRSTKGFLEGLPRLLEVCDHYGAPATLFCEARLVEEFPDEFRDLSRGHEIGCHSYNHEWLGMRLPPRLLSQRGEFPILPTGRKEMILAHAKRAIGQAVGRQPRSFKAPFNSVDHVSVLSLLEKIGFDSDSSLPYYNDESFSHPLCPSPCRHVSPVNLWNPGAMHLLEVPFTVRPHPMFWRPFSTREDLLDVMRRSIKLALECVELQCRIDMLAGGIISVVHVTSHPWEFSDVIPTEGYGKDTAKMLRAFFDRLMSMYNVEFLTVSDFTDMWEKDWCPSHSSKRMV